MPLEIKRFCDEIHLTDREVRELILLEIENRTGRKVDSVNIVGLSVGVKAIIRLKFEDES